MKILKSNIMILPVVSKSNVCEGQQVARHSGVDHDETGRLSDLHDARVDLLSSGPNDPNVHCESVHSRVASIVATSK